jgi:deoxyribonuclease-1-like protein
MNRAIGTGFVVVALVIATIFAGCIEELPIPMPTPSSSPTPSLVVTPIPSFTPLPTPSASPSSDGNQSEEGTLRIGAFNIQVFGTTKASKPEVMDVLGKIIRTYDVVAIQEIRDASQTALPALVDEVNSDGSKYDYAVSERLGRTTSKEQYAYIYNTQTVELTDTPHTYPEPNETDPFHREPYIASFKALDGNNFDVTLMVIHTDPDEATEEINALDAVVEYAQSVYTDEQDFIVMGDLNADCSYFDEDSSSTLSSTGYYWCVNNSVDTTTKTTDCTYDRIIITNEAVSDFTGDTGVFRFDTEYSLTTDETTAVSDHYPVYVEFWSDRDTD